MQSFGKMALAAALLSMTAGAALAQTANDGSVGTGGSPGVTAGQTRGPTGHSSDATAPARGHPGPNTTGMGVSPRHPENGPTIQNGFPGESPSSAPENQ